MLSIIYHDKMGKFEIGDHHTFIVPSVIWNPSSSYLLSIANHSALSHTIAKRYTANVSPCSTPVVMSKAVSPSGDCSLSRVPVGVLNDCY